MELKCISLWYNCAFISIIQRIGSSLIYNTSARNERHEYDTGPTRARHEWRECNTNVIGALHEHTSEKISILITTRLKRYFHIPIFFVWQVKDYKGEEQFILSTTFGNASFPCQNAFEKCTTKTRLCNGKSYIKNLYTRL